MEAVNELTGEEGSLLVSVTLDAFDVKADPNIGLAR